MSLPRIKKEPSYVNTDLKELKRDFLKSIKPIEKSKSPISSKNVKSLSKLQTIVEEKINDASILPPIKKRSHKNYNNRYPEALPQITKLGPQITKLGGKKRTRKNKSNRRRTLRKK